jgi:hypothetical protein
MLKSRSEEVNITRTAGVTFNSFSCCLHSGASYSTILWFQPGGVVVQKISDRILAAQSVVALLAAALCCGGSNRQLQTITAKSTGMTQLQFTATGLFSASPASVSPLPVSWWEGPALLDPPFVYTLSSQPYSIECRTDNSVIAIAPTDPNAPATGSIPAQVFEALVSTETGTAEGGFVASAPQSISCP